MAITLNTYPIITAPAQEIKVCSLSYSKEKLAEVRTNYSETHSFLRSGDQILGFAKDNTFPFPGKIFSVLLKENHQLLTFLFRDALIRFLKNLGRNPTGFTPIELISKRSDDNLLASIIKTEFPFAIFSKYELHVRLLNNRPHLVIDCQAKRIVTRNCRYFSEKGFDIIGRYITNENERGYVSVIGRVIGIDYDQITYKDRNGEIKTINADNVSLEGSNTNFDEYIKFIYGKEATQISEKIRIHLSSFNSGPNKKDKIDRLARYLQSQEIASINGIIFKTGIEIDISNECQQFPKPIFLFNDGGEADWVEKGISQFGPYTKRTFDRNDPSICVICAQQHKGEIEQFIRKFLKGISGHKYFDRGLEGKFHIGTSRVEFFTFLNDSANDYKNAIENAIRKKAQEGDKWDLALVQVRTAQKELPIDKSPYYIARSIFFLHQTPVHNFTFELLSQNDNNLGYSLNNMALATYAKMGGVPWLLKSSPTLSHELVIGIGSAHIGEERFGPNERIMGITTVFSGDGSYIVSNTSKAVQPNAYKNALTEVLKETLERIREKRNWQKGDTIRIVFHASIKKFNRAEIEAVKDIISYYSDFNVEYAFLKISEDHGLHMFDTSTASDPKGKFAPVRGKYLKLSNDEILVYLIGGAQLKKSTDGHPRGLIVNLHKDSNFTDIKYLTSQLFNFSAHSWRSYFPNHMPVTISYSDLIAHNLGWLEKVHGWNATAMIGKIGKTQWFL